MYIYIFIYIFSHRCKEFDQNGRDSYLEEQCKGGYELWCLGGSERYSVLIVHQIVENER